MSASKELRAKMKERVWRALSMKVTDRLSAMSKIHEILWNTQELISAFGWMSQPVAVDELFGGLADFKEIIRCLDGSLTAAYEAWDFVAARLTKIAPEVLEAAASYGEPDWRIHQ